MTEPATTTPDFTKPREPHRFRLGGHDYAAPAILSSVELRKAAGLAATWRETETTDLQVIVALIGEAFTILIPGPQGQEISHRITTDEEDPIDLRGEALPCFLWLMEAYGLRPTQPSPDSANGLSTPTGDTSSTDGALLTESTSTS